MSGPPAKRIWRSGVRFDCPECGSLWKDDAAHAPVLAEGCTACGGGDLRLVGQGDAIVQGARWFRCLTCSELFMHRRGELVTTAPRTGFAEFTEFS